MPVSGTIAREPNRLLIVWVAATTLPSPSATVRCVVCAEPAGPTPEPNVPALPMSMSARRAAAYSLAIRRATGTSMNAGSPVAAVRSANAILSASASRWMPSTVPKPSSATSKPSSRLRIWIRWMPPAVGGGQPTISKPRYVPRTGVRSTVR